MMARSGSGQGGSGRRRKLRGLLAALVVTALAVACGGGSSDENTVANGGTGGGGKCVVQAECGVGQYCKVGKCTACSCAPGVACDESGTCQPNVGTCTPSCSSGQFCSALGSCIPVGSCKTDADCVQSPGLKCNVAEQKCVPGGECGEKDFKITALPPNLMIVLDRSGSMGGSVPNSGGKSRWQVASEAIAALTASFAGKINFGLTPFSACTGNGCAPGVITNAIGASAAQINATIAGTTLCNSGDPETVIGGTLQGFVGDQSLQQPGRDNAILLITDGADNCGGGGAGAATALLGQAVPVTTYVVGFSGDVNKSELTAIAQAAGTAPYYQADDATQLNAALSKIASGVASCTYTLDGVPPSGGLFVFFDKNPAGVPADGNNGWSYDPTSNTITFHGSSCDQIKKGTVTQIDVIYSCSQPVPS